MQAPGPSRGPAASGPTTPRILYLVTDLDAGGAEKGVRVLATTLHRKGWPTAVIGLGPMGRMGEGVRAEGVPVLPLGLPRSGIEGMSRLLRAVRTFRPDILHAFLFHANLTGRWAAAVAGVPVMLSSIRVSDPRRMHLWLDRLTLRWTDIEICVCEGVRRYTVERAGIPSDRLRVVRNGVGPHRGPGRTSARRALGIPTDARLVVSVGRLDRQKGYLPFLDSIPAVREAVGDLRVRIAGEGPLRAALERRLARLGLERCVAFPGRTDDVATLLDAADLYVQPSRWEGLPNTLLEGMAAGLPVVASPVGGIPEAVEHGRNGRLVPFGDVPAWTRAIRRLLSDREAAGRLGRAAAESMRAWTWDRTVEEHERIYRERLAAAVRRGAG